MSKHMRHALIASALALVLPAAFATAAGASDPQATACKGLDPGVRNIQLGVTPATAGSVSSFSGSVLLCGSDLSKTSTKGFTSGTITMPWARKGWPNPTYVQLIQTRCANPLHYKTKGGSGKSCPTGSGPYSLQEGQFTGSVGMGIATGSGLSFNNILSNVFVQKAPGSPAGVSSTRCTVEAVACLQGIDNLKLGYADMTIERVPKGSASVLDTYQFKIYPIVSLVLNEKLFYTKIGYPNGSPKQPLKLCEYAGAVYKYTTLGYACGNAASDDWVQKNGPEADASCDVIRWMLLGLPGGYNGVGFIIKTDNNVTGADDWWGTKVQKAGKSWMDDKSLVAEIQKANGMHPFCSPLKLSAAGGTPSSPAPKQGPEAPDKGEKSSGNDRNGGESSHQRGSSHQKSSHKRFGGRG